MTSSGEWRPWDCSIFISTPPFWNPSELLPPSVNGILLVGMPVTYHHGGGIDLLDLLGHSHYVVLHAATTLRYIRSVLALVPLRGKPVQPLVLLKGDDCKFCKGLQCVRTVRGCARNSCMFENSSFLISTPNAQPICARGNFLRQT